MKKDVKNIFEYFLYIDNKHGLNKFLDEKVNLVSEYGFTIDNVTKKFLDFINTYIFWIFSEKKKMEIL